MKKYVSRLQRRRRRQGILIGVLTVLVAVLVPVCVLLARGMIPFPNTAVHSPQDDIPVSSDSEPPDEPDKEPDEPDPVESEPEEAESEIPDGGLVPESEVQPQSFLSDAVFFGDSLTAGLGLYGNLGAQVIAGTGVNPQTVFDRPVINVPGSDERISMMTALENVSPSPSKIYIEIGANWVGEQSGITEKTFLKQYLAMLDAIRELHPESIVYIQSILPVSREYDTNENGQNRYGLTNELIRTFNASLEQLAEEQKVWFLDVYSALADEEGYLPSEQTTDGMHLKPDFYNKWTDYLCAHAAPETEDTPPGEEDSSSFEEEGGAESVSSADPADSSLREESQSSASSSEESLDGASVQFSEEGAADDTDLQLEQIEKETLDL